MTLASFDWLSFLFAKMVTWSIMKSLPSFPSTNMAEGCNSGKQGNPTVCLLFGSICLKTRFVKGKSIKIS